jgi:hypothetical protein
MDEDMYKSEISIRVIRGYYVHRVEGEKCMLDHQIRRCSGIPDSSTNVMEGHEYRT